MGKKDNSAKKSTIFIPRNNSKETERYFGTPRGAYVVKTNTAVEVPEDVKAAWELAEMQENERLRRVEKMRLKNPEELK